MWTEGVGYGGGRVCGSCDGILIVDTYQRQLLMNPLTTSEQQQQPKNPNKQTKTKQIDSTKKQINKPTDNEQV